MEFMTEPIPTWALCYLINGDRTGLNDTELAMIDKWYADNKVQTSPLPPRTKGTLIPISHIFLLSDLRLKLWTAL